jgi:Family of unknown function (DUF6600)/FecR protein
MRGMMFALAVGVAACLLAVNPATVRALEVSYARIVRLSLVQGNVEVAQPDQTGAQKALVNLPLRQGASLTTGPDGRAEVEFESAEVAEVASDSSLRLSELALANGGRISRLSLTNGTVSVSAHPSGRDSFSIETSGLTVTPVKKSEFRVDAAGNRTDVRVFAGEVAVASPAGTHRVKKGHELVAEGGTLRLGENHPLDGWDRWVRTRYKTANAEEASTQRYARAPFSYGLADMAAFGDWYSLPGYGYGWQPWGMPIGWTPFYNGYWGSFPGFGWTWISYEPWGWVPYHFGRWAFIPGFGWAWLPGFYSSWCPAPVYWYQTANWVGWAPLPPGVPYGQTPRAAPAVTVVTNSTAGLLGRAPNRIRKLSAGTPVTLSAFAPLTGTHAGLPGAAPFPRVIAPATAKLPRALPAPGKENPRRVVIRPAPPTPPRGSKATSAPRAILLTPKRVAPRTTPPSTATPRTRLPQPSPEPMPRAQPRSTPPRGTPPPHRFVMEGAQSPRIETHSARPPEAAAPRERPSPPRNFTPGPAPRPGVFMPAARGPREEPGTPRMPAGPQPSAAREARAGAPPHR